MKIYVLFVLTAPFCVNNLYIPTENINAEKAEEIQNAICSITTKEIEATANATITRQLKGVCTSNELTLKIDKLQTKILQEIDGIRYILEMNGFKVTDMLSNIDNTTSDIKNIDPTSDFQNVDHTLISDSKHTKSVEQILLNGNSTTAPRVEEILMYNDTTIDSEEGNKYFYYWKIDNIQELLRKTDMYKSSPTFTVLGHLLHLQLYPNYLIAHHFAVLLKSENPGFIKKHKLVILNQLDPGLDLASGILYGIQNEVRMLRISEKNLNVEGFVVQNCMLVKVEIILDP